MASRRREIHRLVEEQAKRWLYEGTKSKQSRRAGPAYRPVIVLSRQRGSGGSTIAGKVAEKLDYPLFHSEIVKELARRLRVDPSTIESSDESTRSRIRDWSQSLFSSRYATYGEYMEHLVKLVATIGELGGAVIVGRGAGLILPREQCFRVRIVAPMAARIARVAAGHGLDEEKAAELVQWTDRERHAFVKESFHAEDSDAANYDLVVNTGTIGSEMAVQLIVEAYRKLLVSDKALH